MPAPSQFYPRTSGPHRIACIALYRSLLEQSVRIPLPAKLSNEVTGLGKIHPIKHFIQKKFRQNTQHASPRLIVSALKAGYAAEELLHAANTGSTTALSQIHSLLTTLHRRVLSSRKSCTQPPPRPTSALKARLRAYPGAPKVSDIRPLPLKKISANRHVPSLSIATHLPFLRFKKEQSPYLSRVISQKVRQKVRRLDWLEALGDGVEMGRWEGEWDDCVLEEMEGQGREDVAEKDSGEGGRQDWIRNSQRLVNKGWDEEPARALKGVQRCLRTEFSRAGKLADTLVGVVESEKKLWEQERRDRREAKREAKRFEKGDRERKIKTNRQAEKKLEDWKKEVEAW